MIPQNYEDIKSYVKTALSDRQSSQTPPELRPSKYWEFFTDHLNYVRDLPDSELKNIRRHTFHLTGDIYQVYLLSPPSFFEKLRRDCNLLDSRLDASNIAEDAHGFGYEVNGRHVSVDLLRYLQVLCDLTEAEVFTSKTNQSLLEIGGGYGGLAAASMKYNPQTSYVLCDLEETLFFQAVHLSNQFGFSSIELCDSDFSAQPHLEPGRFYLVPQSRLELLENRTVDLAINQQSMQEMNQPQALRYCECIKQSARWFYSCNLQHDSEVARRTKIVRDVCELTDTYFGTEIWNRMPPKHLFNQKSPRWKKILGRRLCNFFRRTFTTQQDVKADAGDWLCQRKIYICREDASGSIDGLHARAAAA